MAAVELTEKAFMMLSASWKIIQAVKATQSDWITLPVKGVIAVVGVTDSTAATAAETPTFGTVTINNGGAAYTAASTAIAVDGALATRVTPYYLLSASGEIIEVTNETAPATAAGTLTIKRGCFGTTPSATGLANNDVLSVLNQIVLASATVGGELLAALVLPEDPGAKLA
jgi:hypothetical protein